MSLKIIPYFIFRTHRTCVPSVCGAVVCIDQIIVFCCWLVLFVCTWLHFLSFFDTFFDTCHAQNTHRVGMEFFNLYLLFPGTCACCSVQRVLLIVTLVGYFSSL